MEEAYGNKTGRSIRNRRSPRTGDFVSPGDRRAQEQVSRVIIGQGHVVDHLLITLLVGGHCLITGMPGTAKTLLVKTLADALGLTFKRIQFTPDLMPTDVTGTDIIEEDAATGHRSWTFVKGPIFTNVLLARRNQQDAAQDPGRAAGSHAGALGDRAW